MPRRLRRARSEATPRASLPGEDTGRGGQGGRSHRDAARPGHGRERDRALHRFADEAEIVDRAAADLGDVSFSPTRGNAKIPRAECLRPSSRLVKYSLAAKLIEPPGSCGVRFPSRSATETYAIFTPLMVMVVASNSPRIPGSPAHAEWLGESARPSRLEVMRSARSPSYRRERQPRRGFRASRSIRTAAASTRARIAMPAGATNTWFRSGDGFRPQDRRSKTSRGSRERELGVADPGRATASPSPADHATCYLSPWKRSTTPTRSLPGVPRNSEIRWAHHEERAHPARLDCSPRSRARPTLVDQHVRSCVADDVDASRASRRAEHESAFAAMSSTLRDRCRRGWKPRQTSSAPPVERVPASNGDQQSVFLGRARPSRAFRGVA